MRRFIINGIWDALLNILLMGAMREDIRSFWLALGLFALVDALMILLLFGTVAVKAARQRRADSGDNVPLSTGFSWKGAFTQFAVGMALSAPFLLVFGYQM